MIKLLDFFKSHIKKFYYFVPPCPLCGSPITGRFMQLHRDAVTEWQVTESLKNGELIKPLHDMSSKTCFCLNCNYEWIGDVKLKFLSLKDIEEEKTKRLTRDILNSRIAAERAQKKKDHSLFKGTRRFIGKF